MTEKLKALWAKLKEHLKKISKKVYIFAGVALVVLAAVVAWQAACPFRFALQ